MTRQTKQNPATATVNRVFDKSIKSNFTSTKLNLSSTDTGGVSNTQLQPLELTLSELIVMFQPDKIKVGSKDGPYFVRGRCEGNRSDKAMLHSNNLLIIIDGDSSVNEDGEVVEGAPDPELAHKAMKEAGIEHLIYTSHSHHKHGENFNKWRLLVPSDGTPETLASGVDAIIDILHSAGVKVAPVSENNSLSQPWYFPRVEAGRAAFYYSSSYETGKLFNVPVKAPEPIPFATKAKPKQRGESVVQAYCDRYPLQQKVEELGFKHIRENRYLPPESKSGVAGAKIITGERDGRERLYIHNTSHPLHGKGLDSFDLFCEQDHRGDFKEAVKAAADLLGLAATDDAFAMFIAAEDREETQEQETLPINVSGVRIENPPGLAGEMCQHLNLTAKRPIPLIYPIVALQMLSLAAGVRKGLEGIKLNLLTLAIAPSAAGKEHGQSWLAEVAAQLKLGRHVVGGISSDVDMIRNVIEGDGRCCYRIDEIQGLFKSINSKNANTYESKIGDLILQLATSNVYLFAGNHRRQFNKEIDHDIEQLKKKIAKAEEGQKLETVEDPDVEKLSRALRRLYKKRDFIENGWPDPIVSIMGHSTPTGLDSLITEENIGSGLIGRCLVIRCAEEREKLQQLKKPPFLGDATLINRLHQINKGSLHPLKVSEQAKVMLEAIQDYYDQDQRLNAPVMGAIYARVMEQVNKVASLLALEVGEVQPEHVSYAFSLVARCIGDVGYLLQKDAANRASATTADIALHTRADIKRRLSTDKVKTEGIAPSALKQAVLKCFVKLKHLTDQHNKTHQAQDKPDFYDQVINRMEQVGDIALKQSGKKKRYVLTGAVK
ncbi:hypothetical protein [uncultured Paraglaciecola sp.]|uniref:hypothetical protein n=1 Tax=uncultured Paraglaciecola sp. TaxID=1765024 RepID=UPI00260A6298|nr:hypothetical protein [uncultured Paraglaciecola sp.]